jgi:drug/metabolite transporter (DMT)-like permease
MNLIIYSLIIAFLWGVSPIAHKKMLSNIDTKIVFILNSIFYTGCIILYIIYYWNNLKEEYVKLKTNDIYILAGISILLSFIPNFIYFYLLKNHDSSIVSALVNSAPIFTIGVSYFLLSEKITNKELFGIGLIILGIIFLSIKN